MIFIQTGEREGNKAPIQLIHYAPEQLSEEVKKQGVLTESVPKPVAHAGKTAIGYWNFDSKQVEYEYVEAPVSTIEQEFAALKASIEPASVIYDALDKTGVDVAELKKLRILKLKEECTADIYAGFASGEYEFGYNAQDQDNFSKRLATIAIGAPGPFKWKSLNAGVVELSKAEFIQVVTDAEAHQLREQEKYWALEQQVLNAGSVEAVDAVKW